MNTLDLIGVFITSISSVIIALIGKGYFTKLRHRKARKESKLKLIEQIEKDEIVHMALKDLKRKYRADRIYIWQFHNGGNYYTESSIQRASISYERCSDGLERNSEKYQGIIISLFNWYIKKLLTDDSFFTDTKEIKDVGMRGILFGNGSVSHAAVPIYDDSKHLIGILCLDWIYSDLPHYVLDDDDNFSEEFKKEFKSEGSSLKTYL